MMVIVMRGLSCALLVAGASAFVPSFTPSSSSLLVHQAATASSSVALQQVSSQQQYLCMSSDEGMKNMICNRRDAIKNAFLFGIGGAAILPNIDWNAHAEDPEVDYKAIRKAIDKMIRKEPSRGPTLVRLAWHSSGTYDKNAMDGGSSGGTIRYKEELGHGANAGLDIAVKWMEPIKEANPGISYGDLYTLAGVQAIESLGGPQVKWRAGRKDGTEADVTQDGRLPDADRGTPEKTLAGLREIFGRMGFNDQEIVALSGAHALGRCHKTASGYDGPWTFTPTSFNNQYYVLLNNLRWTPREWNGPFQYKDPTGSLMMLPSDLYLLEDKKLKKYVKMYAKDEKKFFDDFSAAFNKLQELGCKDLHDV